MRQNLCPSPLQAGGGLQRRDGVVAGGVRPVRVGVRPERGVLADAAVAQVAGRRQGPRPGDGGQARKGSHRQEESPRQIQVGSNGVYHSDNRFQQLLLLSLVLKPTITAI